VVYDVYLKTANVDVQCRLPVPGSIYLEYISRDQKYSNENILAIKDSIKQLAQNLELIAQYKTSRIRHYECSMGAQGKINWRDYHDLVHLDQMVLVIVRWGGSTV
jgi:hypothetical protein